MNASIIIPTYNGSSKILSLLQSLENQTCENFEILIVIDGSTDNTIDVLNSRKFNFKEFKIISQSNLGRAGARNKGANAAKYDLYLFFDDDMILEKDCVERHITHHIKYANTILVGIARMNIFYDIKNDFYNYRYKIEEKWQMPFKDKLTRVSYEQYSFSSGNLSVSRQIFNGLNGFDELLRDSEDFDFSMKALKQSIPIFIDYNTWAWHADYINLGGYITRQKEYIKSKTHLAILKPEYLKLHPESFSINKISKFKKILSRIFIYNPFWKFLLLSKFFLIFPEKIRYRLYSIIIFSSTIR